MLSYSLKLQDLFYLNGYMIDLTISVCLESTGTCMLVETVLDGTVLPKTVCDWSSGLQGEFI